jgi:hypothetical protein
VATAKAKSQIAGQLGLSDPPRSVILGSVAMGDINLRLGRLVARSGATNRRDGATNGRPGWVPG